MRTVSLTVFVLLAAGETCAAVSQSLPNAVAAPVLQDGQQDFDFEIGVWHTHLKRRLHPLTGSVSWVDYDGTTTVRPVWNGAGNLVELSVNGSAGHFQGLSLRLYNPQTHQWALNFSTSSTGRWPCQPWAVSTLGVGFINRTPWAVARSLCGSSYPT